MISVFFLRSYMYHKNDAPNRCNWQIRDEQETVVPGVVQNFATGADRVVKVKYKDNL